MQVGRRNIQGIVFNVSFLFKGIFCKLWYFHSISKKLLGTYRTTDLRTMMMMMMVDTYGMFCMYKTPLQLLDDHMDA